MFDPLSMGPGPGAAMPQAAGVPLPGTTGLVAPVGAPPVLPSPAPVSSPIGGPAFPAMPIDPANLQYHNETQSDGSILIRLLNPDGSPGPVVDIVRTPKPKGAKHPHGPQGHSGH